MNAIAYPSGTSSQPAPSLWQRLKNKFSKPMEATGLSPEVQVLQTQVIELLERVALLEAPQVPTPSAVLPTDVYLAGRRHTAEGVLYTTTAVTGTDRFIGGSRVSDTGEQVITV